MFLYCAIDGNHEGALLVKAIMKRKYGTMHLCHARYHPSYRSIFPSIDASSYYIKLLRQKQQCMQFMPQTSYELRR